MSQPLIDLQHISKRFDDTLVLDDLSLSVKENSFVTLLGPSGCGKTTFTHLLNGLSPEFYPGTLTGRCTAAGLAAGEAAIEAYVPQVGSVFQNPKTQYFNVDTTAELAFPCENAGMEPQAIRRRVDETLKRVGMYEFRNNAPHLLSGGQKQRVAIARMLTKKTPVIVFDDSLSAVDTETDEKIRSALDRDLGGATTIIISHRITTLLDCDNILVLEKGRVSQLGSPKELLAQPGIFRKIYDMQMSIGEEEGA